MRPDVKLGIVISLVVVVVAGGYYVYRDVRDAPIPVTGGAADLADAQSPKNAKPAGGASAESKRQIADRSTPTSRSDPKQRRDGNRAARGSKQNDAPSKSRVANRRPGNTGASRRKSTGHPNPATGSSRKSGATTAASDPNRNSRSASKGGQANSLSAGEVTEHTPQPNRTKPSPVSGTDRMASKRSNPPVNRSREKPVGHMNRERQIAAQTAPAERRGGSALASRSTGPNAPTQKSNIAVETHLLQPGDTLAGLAMAYYGSERHIPVLIAANPQIKDPSRLRVGARINIPPDPMARDVVATSGRAVPNSPQPATVVASSRSYTVKPGDSFYAIAQSQLGSSNRWKEVFEMNRSLVKDDPKRLQVGQVIELPE